MKRLPPSQREKQRYISFKIHSDEELELGQVVETFWDACLRYMGTKGASQANFWVIGNKFDQEEQEGIVRVNREFVNDLRAAVATAEKLSGEKGFIEFTRASGSIKGLES